MTGEYQRLNTTQTLNFCEMQCGVNQQAESC